MAFTATVSVPALLPAKEKENYIAARNIKKIHAMETEQLNVFDILNAQYLILSKDSVEQIVHKYTK